MQPRLPQRASVRGCVACERAFSDKFHEVRTEVGQPDGLIGLSLIYAVKDIVITRHTRTAGFQFSKCVIGSPVHIRTATVRVFVCLSLHVYTVYFLAAPSCGTIFGAICRH